MHPLDAFSPSYEVARERFRDTAARTGARLECHDVASGEGRALTMDVASVGARAPRWAVVVTGGLHGVEGFFGSAVQLAWLTALADAGRAPHDGVVVLVHAVNPVGFAGLRRTNEDNVDLNRNVLPAGTPYAGAPAGYIALDPFLNPPTPPSRLEPFRLKAVWHILRRGLPALTQAVAGGQYRFPRGLFFGGCAPARSTTILQHRLATWIAGAQNAVHLDLHTGLGAWGGCRLLLEPRSAPDLEWYQETFGADLVEVTGQDSHTEYHAAGSLGGWALAALRDTRYRFLTAEFGTHSVVRVLSALRAENRAHFHANHNTRRDRSKVELVECFCPRDERWRTTVVARAVSLIDRAVQAQSGAPS